MWKKNISLILLPCIIILGMSRSAFCSSSSEANKANRFITLRGSGRTTISKKYIDAGLQKVANKEHLFLPNGIPELIGSFLYNKPWLKKEAAKRLLPQLTSKSGSIEQGGEFSTCEFTTGNIWRVDQHKPSPLPPGHVIPIHNMNQIQGFRKQKTTIYLETFPQSCKPGLLVHHNGIPGYDGEALRLLNPKIENENDIGKFQLRGDVEGAKVLRISYELKNSQDYEEGIYHSDSIQSLRKHRGKDSLVLLDLPKNNEDGETCNYLMTYARRIAVKRISKNASSTSPVVCPQGQSLPWLF